MKKEFALRPPSPQASTALNLAAIQGFYSFAWAFSCYGTVYLQNNNFPASSLGSLNALSSTVAIFALMLWGICSDKINSIKKTFFIALLGCAFFHALTPFLPADTPFSVLLFFIYFPFVNVFRCAMPTLLDNLTVRTCAQRRINYGFVRGFGSFTFVLGSLLVVGIIPILGVGSTFWLAGLLSIPTLLFLLLAHDPKRIIPPEEKKVKISPKPLLRNYFYMSFMLFTAIIFIAISAEFSFLTYYMEGIGVSNSNYGTFLAVRALAEVPMLLLIVRLRAKIRLKYIIMLACGLMALQCLLLGVVARDLVGMLWCGVLFGLGNGLFLGTVSMYIYKLAPDHLKASSQTIFGAISSISGIVGNLIGGFACELFGARSFYLILGGILFFGVLVLAISFLLKRNLPNPGDVKG